MKRRAILSLVLAFGLTSVANATDSNLEGTSGAEEKPLQITLKIVNSGPHREVFHLDDPIQIGFDVEATDAVYREPLMLNNRSLLLFKGKQRVLMPERMENRIYPFPGYNIFSLDEIIKPHGLGEYRIKMVYSYKERSEEKLGYFAATRGRWFGEAVSNELTIKVIPVLPEKVKRIRNILSDMKRARFATLISANIFERHMNRLIALGKEAVPYIIDALLAEREERSTLGWASSIPFLSKALILITDGEPIGFDVDIYRREFEMHKNSEDAIWKAAKWIQWWEQKAERDGVPEEWLSIRLNEHGYLTGDSLAQSLQSVLDALEDKDLWICLNAGIWLKRYAGKDFGYDASSPLAKRQQAVAKWRVWYEQQKKR